MPKEKKETTEEPPRSKSWACLIYPESALDNWMEKAKETKLKILISPLHDRDYDEKGTPKKPHHHVQVFYASPHSAAQARADFEAFGGIGAERVRDQKQMARYLCHLDNPEKAQYEPSAVVALNGMNYEPFLVADLDRVSVMKEIIRFIRENGLISFADLVDYAEANRADWFKVLSDSRTFLQDYIKSFAWGIQKGIGGTL